MEITLIILFHIATCFPHPDPSYLISTLSSISITCLTYYITYYVYHLSLSQHKCDNSLPILITNCTSSISWKDDIKQIIANEIKINVSETCNGVIL